MSSLSKFFRRSEVWVVFFYKSNDKNSNLKDIFKDLANKYLGIFKVAAVDCFKEEEVCHEEFSAFETPKIVVYEANMRAEPHKYQGKNDLLSIAKFAVSFMESFVHYIGDHEGYLSFISNDVRK